MSPQEQAANAFGSAAPTSNEPTTGTEYAHPMPEQQPIETTTSVDSAADLFSGPSPDKVQDTTTFNNTLSQPVEAKDLFATPSPNKVPLSTSGAASQPTEIAAAPSAPETAADVFSAPSVTADEKKDAAEQTVDPAPTSNVTETTRSLDESTDEGMVDVPLSPQGATMPPPPITSTKTAPIQPPSTTNTTNAATAAELFGLPPPPFSSK